MTGEARCAVQLLYRLRVEHAVVIFDINYKFYLYFVDFP